MVVAAFPAMHDTDNPFDYSMGTTKEIEDMQAEPNDFDTPKTSAIHPVQIVTDLKTGKEDITESGIEVGARGFLAVLKDGTITAPTRKDLRKRIASLMTNEAYIENGTEPIEIYRVTRLPLARKVDFKF